MGLRFRRSIKLGKYAKINLGKKGASLSMGVRGAHVTVGKNGVRNTVGIPGTGISYTDYERYNNTKNKQNNGMQQNKHSFTDNIIEKANAWRDCPIDNKEDKIKYPAVFWRELIISIGLIIATVFFIPFAVFALISLIIMLFTVIFNKQIKASAQQWYAIRAYHLRNGDECIERCKKSLKYMDCDSTRRLLELTENEINN